MIKANFNFKQNTFISLNITGHAEHKKNNDEYDIVCAGVSSIVFGILNKLAKENFEGNIIVEENLIIVENKESIKDNTIDIIIDTLIVQLKTIEESYSKHLSVKIQKNKNWKVTNKGETNVL